MKYESNTATFSSVLMGVGVGLVGAFFEPLLLVLGIMIIVSGVLASFVESRRMRIQMLEAQDIDKNAALSVEQKTA